MTGVDLEALLLEHEACEEWLAEAVAVFGTHLPPGVSVAWSVAVAAGEPRLQSWAGWAVGRLCRPEEVGIVAGAYLRGAWLQWAALESADLREADLREADLREADLREADMWRADLRVANLREADMWRADLRVANLREADLRRADLREADLREADLRGADLTAALRMSTDDPIPGWVLVNGRLRRAE